MVKWVLGMSNHKLFISFFENPFHSENSFVVDSHEYQKHPLIYLKLYPYILVLFFLSGSVTIDFIVDSQLLQLLEVIQPVEFQPFVTVQAILIRLLWSNYNGKVSAMVKHTININFMTVFSVGSDTRWC